MSLLRDTGPNKGRSPDLKRRFFLVDHHHLRPDQDFQNGSFKTIVNPVLQVRLCRKPDTEIAQSHSPIFGRRDSQGVSLGHFGALENPMVNKGYQELLNTAFMTPLALAISAKVISHPLLFSRVRIRSALSTAGTRWDGLRDGAVPSVDPDGIVFPPLAPVFSLIIPELDIYFALAVGFKSRCINGPFSFSG
jgi:hypothetical protein